MNAKSHKLNNLHPKTDIVSLLNVLNRNGISRIFKALSLFHSSFPFMISSTFCFFPFSLPLFYMLLMKNKFCFQVELKK